MKEKDLEKRIWWDYLHQDLKELLMQSQLLIDSVEDWKDEKIEEFHDYAFVVFPAAKAYEGFLKTLFKDLRFISSEDYYGKRFRIGKALNPSLEKRFREKEGVYDRIVSHCGGKSLADNLWKTWKECRNILFHWFPNERNAIDSAEAQVKVNLIMDTMDLAFEGCGLDSDR